MLFGFVFCLLCLCWGVSCMWRRGAGFLPLIYDSAWYWTTAPNTQQNARKITFSLLSGDCKFRSTMQSICYFVCGVWCVFVCVIGNLMLHSAGCWCLCIFTSQFSFLFRFFSLLHLLFILFTVYSACVVVKRQQINGTKKEQVIVCYILKSCCEFRTEFYLSIPLFSDDSTLYMTTQSLKFCVLNSLITIPDSLAPYFSTIKCVAIKNFITFWIDFRSTASLCGEIRSGFLLTYYRCDCVV